MIAPATRETGRQPMTINAQSIADAFVAARLGAQILDTYPGEMPATMGQAYAIQDCAIAAFPDTIAAWKVGLMSDADQARLGLETPRFAGPIFARTVHRHAGHGVQEMPVFANGLASVEGEFVFRTTRDMTDADAIDPTGLATSCALHYGVEIPSSPFRGINLNGPTCTVSDFGNNRGLIVGGEITDWQTRDWNDLEVEILVDGASIGRASGPVIPGTPLTALRFMLGHLGGRGLPVPSGTFITTGAVVGINDRSPGFAARVEFPGFGGIDVALTAVMPA
jgi:2-keto-4-pentenoate hydratase